jgi:thioredoxin reductase (NADPH)
MVEVALVGAGPVGLEIAVALKRRGLSYIQFDAAQIGHTISWWAPGTRFFSSNERIAIAGVPLLTDDGQKSTREHYLSYLRGVVDQFDLDIRRFEPVVAVRPQPDGTFQLDTAKPGQPVATYAAKHVILATGGTAAPRLLNIPGESLPHVTHYFQDPHLYFGQKLLIVGGRNSAAETALRCYHAGAHVTLSYRQPTLPAKSIKYWILPELQNLIDTGKIAAYFSTTPTRITPTHVTLATSAGHSLDVLADFVFLATGYVADMTLFESAGAQLDPKTRAPKFNPETMETSIPNLYVAGTAIAGTQDRYEIFLENCHVHIPRILSAITGTTSQTAPSATPPTPATTYANPES